MVHLYSGMRLPTEILPSHSDLITAARAGSPDALGQMFVRFADALIAVAYRLTASRTEAEDVVQDVFVGLPDALRGYHEQGQFEAWLKRVTVRHALMRMRASSRRPESPLPETDEIASAGHDIALKVSIDVALARLSDSLRTVFVLHEIEGYSHVEIGAALGIRPGTSEVRLFRARALLRAALEDKA
jgi:RNA polymerase sigma-70 factor (ECF subfamily)